MAGRRSNPETPSSSYSDEKVAHLREQIISKIENKGKPLTDAETDTLFRDERPQLIAELIALSRHSPDASTRKWALQELLAQGIGKAAIKKRTDADEVGVVMIERGSYGIPESVHA